MKITRELPEKEYEEVTNFDLAVIEALKGFPENENDAYIYISGKAIPDEGAVNVRHTNISGNVYALAFLIMGSIHNDETLRAIIMDAVLNYFNEEPQEIQQFVEHLKTII